MIDYLQHMRKGALTLKQNYMLGIPTALAGFAIAFLSIPLMQKGTEDISSLAWLLFVGLTTSFFAQGVTIAMAYEAVKTGRTSVGSGASFALKLFFPLLGLSLWMTLVIATGLMLFIAPGLIAYFMVFFALPSAIVDNLMPFAAVRRSVKLIRKNTRDTLMVFLWITSVGLMLGAMNLAANAVPVAGQLVGVVISGAFGGFMSVMLVSTYIELSALEKQNETVTPPQ